MRLEVFARDEDQCQYCKKFFAREELTIDHLVPISDGGLDEITNWVTACERCNQLKADISFVAFVESLGIEPTDLPVHGDPIIDNKELPIQIRLLRKQIFDRARLKGNLGGRSAQKKLERLYRRDFWQTPLGQRLESEWPNLPGQVRVMIPEIETVASTPHDYLLLIELAKSASTRNLIGTVLTANSSIRQRLVSIQDKSSDERLTKRIDQAILRFQRALRAHGLSDNS